MGRGTVRVAMGAAGLVDIEREHIEEERGAIFPDDRAGHQVEVADDAILLP